MGIYGPHQYLEKQPEYGNVLRRRHFAAKKRPDGDALASSECIRVTSIETVVTELVLPIIVVSSSAVTA